MFIEDMKSDRRDAMETLSDPSCDSVQSAEDDGLETLLFDFVEDAKSNVDGDCNRLLFDGSATGGVSVQAGALVGGWEAVIEPGGHFQMTRIDASLDPLHLAITDNGQEVPRGIDSGRLAIELADLAMLGIGDHALGDFGPLNKGRIDRFTGAVKATWGIMLVSEELEAAGIGAVPAIVPMIGCFTPETEELLLAGVGEVVDGPLLGSKLQITTKQAAKCKIVLKAPAEIGKNKGFKDTLTVKLKGTPKNPVTVSFTALFRPNPATKASFNPATVMLAKNGDKATTMVTLTGAKPPQTAYFRASDGGKKIDKDESAVVNFKK